MKNKKTAIILALSVLLVICCVCAACKHTHSWQQGWSADAAQHWHACNGCNERADEAPHTPSQWVIDKAATENETGLKHKECTVCGKKLNEEIIPATGQQHTHTFGSWLTDDVKHWKQCEQCGEIAEEAPHTQSQWVIDKAATETETGLRHTECTVCGTKLSEEIIPATGQQHTHAFGSWLTDDVKHWKQCEQCGEIAEEAPHTPSQWIIDKAATETATGLKHTECTVCGKKLSEETIPATGQQIKGGTVDLYAINDFHGEWDLLQMFAGISGCSTIKTTP